MGLQELKKSIQKASKGTHVSMLSESGMFKSRENIATPAYDLNRILSGSLFKGIPGRSMSLFAGPETSGKSSLMCLCLAEAQRKDYEIIIVDTEGAWDEGFVTRWGLDPSNILYISTIWVDDIMVSLGQIMDSGDEKLAIVVDSIGAIETSKLLKDSLDGDVKADQGQLQRKIKRMLKMLQFISNSQSSLVMCAGHYYGSPGQYGSAEDIGGGKYMKLAPQLIVSLKKSKLFENGDKKKVVGNTLKAITLKNRFYPPFQEAVVEIDYNKGINTHAGMLGLAVQAGLAEKKGSWFEVNGQKYQGEKNTIEEMKKDKELLTKLDKWLENTGYSTINEEIKQQEKEVEGESEEETGNEDEVSAKTKAKLETAKAKRNRG